MEAADMNWRKSTRSQNGGQCVEVGQLTGTVAVRDTTDRGRATLNFESRVWEKFLGTIR